MDLGATGKILITPSLIMNPSLLKAYQDAQYRVKVGERDLSLKVGLLCLELQGIFKELGCSTAAFITAFNPQSNQLSAEENSQRNKRLKTCLREGGYRFFDGYSTDQSENWPKEESLLVLDISKYQADKFAIRFQQNAYLWLESRKVAELRVLTS